MDFNKITEQFGEALLIGREGFVCEHERVTSEVYDVPTGGGIFEPKLVPKRFFKCLDCLTEWSE